MPWNLGPTRILPPTGADGYSCYDLSFVRTSLFCSLEIKLN